MAFKWIIIQIQLLMFEKYPIWKCNMIEIIEREGKSHIHYVESINELLLILYYVQQWANINVK